MTTEAKDRIFSLGQTVITPNAMRTLNPESVWAAMDRHTRCDWGDCEPGDAEENELALDKGLRLLSVYHDRNGVKFWIITEADRSQTTVLSPEDY